MNTNLIAEFIGHDNNEFIGIEEAENMLLEMSNFRPSKTGLPMVIWIMPDIHHQHGPRIKVQKKHGDKVIDPNSWASVTIEDEPEVVVGKLPINDFNLVKEFIILNKEKLLEVWNDEIDPIDFAKIIKKV